MALVATIYLGAGLSKLRYGNGLGWADGETLAFYLKGGSDARHQQFTGPENAPSESAWKDGFGLTAYLYTTASTEHGRLVASQRWLTRLFSLLTLVFELAFPLVFLGGAWRTLLLLIAVAFHACSEHLMLVHFGPYMWLGLLLIDWSAVWRFFRRQKSLPTPAGRVAYR